MVTRRVVSRNSQGHSISVQIRPSEMFQRHHLFVILSCTILALSVINILILKNELIFRMETVVSEGVVLVFSKKQSQVRDDTSWRLLYTQTTEVHTISREDASIHSISSMVDDKCVKMKQVGGRHEVNPQQKKHIRISALALANETKREKYQQHPT